ncbi:MAG: nucleoside hydrolase [Fibrobacteria bacterium]|nr:nucleoside hydrolase [Fibrobacteria bacterium]
MRLFTGVFLLLAGSILFAEPVNVIFDSDFGPDCDDVGALAILHVMADKGDVRILAMGNSTSNQDGPSTMDAVNHYYKRPDIPIGALKGISDLWPNANYTSQLSSQFEQDLGKADGVPDVVKVYRKVLARVPDTSVTFITVGFKVNVANLLQSEPDEFSPLNGMDLVKKKVKLHVDMGGKFPGGGLEHNFLWAPEHTKYLLGNWPTPLILCGFEVGVDIRTGGFFLSDAQLQQTNPVALSYKLWPAPSEGNSSYDLAASQYAVYGLGDMFTLSEEGCADVDANGANSWTTSKKCGHWYLNLKMSASKAGSLFDDLMKETPLPPEQKPDMLNPWPEQCLIETSSCYLLDTAGACQVSDGACSATGACIVKEGLCYIASTDVACSNTSGACSFTAIQPQLRQQGVKVTNFSNKIIFTYNPTEVGPVDMVIYDLQGNMIKDLGYSGTTGTRQITWNGRTERGTTVSKGIYLLLVNSKILTKFRWM